MLKSTYFKKVLVKEYKNTSEIFNITGRNKLNMRKNKDETNDFCKYADLHSA